MKFFALLLLKIFGFLLILIQMILNALGPTTQANKIANT